MRYLRRLIWFIASRLLVILLVLGLLTVAFYFSMNATNIYIIIKDGMARRAQVIMMDEPVSQLDNYFSSSWIARDDWLQSALNNVDPYRDCTVTGFDHRVSLQRVWCWPWDDTASAVVTERRQGRLGHGAWLACGQVQRYLNQRKWQLENQGYHVAGMDTK